MDAITTFSKKGYEEYARRLLKSVRHWPGKLIAYVEEPCGFKHEKIEYRNFWDIVLPGDVKVADFIEHASRMGLNGGDPYNYNQDVVKFCRKVFVQYDALKDMNDMAFWLDADVEITKKITEGWLKSLFNGHPLCYLGRDGFYSECSFVGFDMGRKVTKKFLANYVSQFTTGQVLNLKWWHDCAAFDFARGELGINGNNLSPFYQQGKGLHVFPDSVLGRYMRHDKGQRKYKH